MATAITALIVSVRRQLLETTARFWSDDELKDIMRRGALDLWGAILDLHQDHFWAEDATNPVLKANEKQIAGVPNNCFRVTLIEPRDVSSTGTGHQILFVPKKNNSVEASVSRSLDAQAPDSTSNRTVYYEIVGNDPVRILCVPTFNADIPLRIQYLPTIWPQATPVDSNPIPGESDNALLAWTIAYARAKETESRTPDAGWLAIYATEKQLMLTRLTPRQEQEPEVVEDLFQGFGSF